MSDPALPGPARPATVARIGIGRVGSAVPTAAALDFQLSHARARDAVYATLAPDTLAGHDVIAVHSRAGDRKTYLLRPDLGRRLDPASRDMLAGRHGELAIVVADGLSASAANAHGAALVAAIARLAGDWRLAPIVVAHQARVAIGDEIGALLGADVVIVLIGERPGLSAADGLSAYITWAPRPGRLDSERNCVSSIRPPDGLAIEDAAAEIMRIVWDARSCGCTGVAMLARRRDPDETLLPPG